jgi:hypothetical protein
MTPGSDCESTPCRGAQFGIRTIDAATGAYGIRKGGLYWTVVADDNIPVYGKGEGPDGSNQAFNCTT